MRKGMKIVLASMLLSIGISSFSAYAADGWNLSGNSWVYLDNDGARVKNEWKRGADNLWRYLNDKGEMALNTWADDSYYVDGNGIMVTDSWQKIKEPYSRSEELHWFYFGSSGRVVKDCWKKIAGKNYKFDSDGIMETGWTEDEMYYLGTDGAMRTGWRYLEPPYDEYDDYDDEYYHQPSQDGKYWYYFSGSGKKYTPATSNSDIDYGVYKIDTKSFCFNTDGQMQHGWVYMNGDPDDAPGNSIKGWRYFADAGIANTTYGAAIPGWLALVPPEPLQVDMDHPVKWFYFDRYGVPEIGPEYGEGSTDDFLRVNGKYYLFNEYGNPVSGLQKVKIGKTNEFTAYYFDQNSMTPVRGKQKIEEGDGNRYDYYFSESSYAGRGYTGVRDGYLYYMGKKQEAADGLRYEAITLPNGKTYVVSTSGRVCKDRRVKDADGNSYEVDKSGYLVKYNGGSVRGESFTDPMEPYFFD